VTARARQISCREGLTTHSRESLAAIVPVALLVAIASACSRSGRQAPASPEALLMTPADLQSIPARPPDRRISYGPDSNQYAHLRVPVGPGPHPLVILIHGGCWKAAYATLRDLEPMGDALKDRGIASWNIEYRRLGQRGGGWPGTYLDVGHGIDHVRTIQQEYALDLDRVIVVGHSAGGNLAMWAAARGRVPAASAGHTADPLPLRGAIDLAGPLDLAADIAGYEASCRDSVVTSLLGGTPATVPDRYADASPIMLLPVGIPEVLVWGTRETFVPRMLAEAYVRAATEAGDSVRLLLADGAGHFELASPLSPAWPVVEGAIRSLLDGKLPTAAPRAR
jgi:acetyl esterase/lipase